MKLAMCALLTLAMAANVLAQTVTLDQEEYTPDDPILVDYSGMPPTDGYNWICLSRPDAPTDTNSYITWQVAEGGSGRVSFGTLKPGNYEIRGYRNWPDDGYVVRARVPFRVAPAGGITPSSSPSEPSLAELERRAAEQEGLSLGECRQIMEEQVRLAIAAARADSPQLVAETPEYAAERQRCLDQHAYDERIKALALIGLQASNTWFGPGTAAPRGPGARPAPTRNAGPRDPATSRGPAARPTPPTRPSPVGEADSRTGRRHDPETARTVRTNDLNYRGLGDTVDVGGRRSGTTAGSTATQPSRSNRPFGGNPHSFSMSHWNRLQMMDGRVKAASGSRRHPAPGLTREDINWLRQRQQENPDYFQFLRENLSPDFNVNLLHDAFTNGGMPRQ